MNVRQRVSIVIPVYNEERYLPACLDAISRQTSMPFEVIVVDNNSSDRTADVARKYPFVRVMRESRQGIAPARRTGFNAASGEIIARIDADTRIPPTWVADIQEYLMAHPQVAAVTGKGYFYDFGLHRLTSALHTCIYYGIQWFICGIVVLWGSNMAIRRSAWQKVAHECSLRQDIDEDIDLSLKLKKYKLQTKYDASLIADMSLRRGNLSVTQIAGYLQTWPRNYSINDMPIRAALIWVVMSIAVLFAALATPIAGLFRRS